MEQENQKFEIRDLRQKEQYITDDKFLNGYAKFLEIFSVGVYGSLCRHANKGQKCWPAIRTICEELSIGKDSVGKAIKRLEFWQIIKKYRVGRTANNRYALLDKKCWLPINEENLKKYSEICHIEITCLLHRFQLSATSTSNRKETHIKESKERKDYENKKRPYFLGDTMRFVRKKQKWFVINKYGEWLEFAGKEKDIEWK